MTMLRAFNLKNILVVEPFAKSFTNLQCVRWRRKPRWLPVAKSKMFRVPPRTVIPEDERLELMRLYNNYRTHMKGIRSYLHNEYNVKSVSIDTEEQEKRFNEEFEACIKINDAWNEERRKEREIRHAKELEEQKHIAYKRLDDYMERKKQQLETVEEIVRKEKEYSKNFITRENLEEAIERAISNPVDYNFAIDLQGNVYKGRDAKPETELKEAKINN